MKKLNLLIFVLGIILFSSMVYSLDKPLINITDCYNVTVSYKFEGGVPVPVSFSGCTDKGSGVYYCDCKNTVGNYTVIMQTDGTIIRDSRDYEITIAATRYNLYEDKATFDIKDWGDYVESKSKKLKYFQENNFDESCNDNVQVIYINRTINVTTACANITPQIIDRPVDRPIYIQNITYIENTSKIDLVIAEKNKQVSMYWIIIVILVLILLFLLYRLKQAGY